MPVIFVLVCMLTVKSWEVTMHKEPHKRSFVWPCSCINVTPYHSVFLLVLCTYAEARTEYTQMIYSHYANGTKKLHCSYVSYIANFHKLYYTVEVNDNLKLTKRKKLVHKHPPANQHCSTVFYSFSFCEDTTEIRLFFLISHIKLSYQFHHQHNRFDLVQLRTLWGTYCWSSDFLVSVKHWTVRKFDGDHPVEITALYHHTKFKRNLFTAIQT